MLKYILMILGGVIFIAGYYYMKQNEGHGKPMMFYSLFTYAGLSLVILMGARVLDPFFDSLGDWGRDGTAWSTGGMFCDWRGITLKTCV